MAFVIEKNVPLPPRSTNAGRGPGEFIAAVMQMEVGDSIQTTYTTSGLGGRLVKYSMRSGRKFATRSLEGGVRVWRIA